MNEKSAMIETLVKLRCDIECLEILEATLVAKIVSTFKHGKIGQSTYDLDDYKITIKTGENVTLDKAVLNALWSESMPINRSYSYTLREKDFKAVMKSGAPELRKQLSDIVTTKSGKPSIKIESKQ